MAAPCKPKEEYRGVMIVGKTGAGKSTVANAIAGSDNAFEVKSSFESATKTISHVKFYMHDIPNGRVLKVKLMDTIGLFDTRSFSNGTIVEKMRLYVNRHFSKGLNLIIFVLREGRFTDEEQETFDCIKKKFKKFIPDIAALVITNCDLKSESARAKIIDEMKTDKLTKPTAELMRAGIYTVGFPSLSDMEVEDVFQEAYKKIIAKDKAKLKDLVIKSDKVVLHRELFDRSFWELCVLF